MARKKKPLPLIEHLEIIDAGAEGKAVGKWNGKVVFVPFAAPGDVVDVKVFKKKKSFLEGKITTYHKSSELRIDPKCAHFGLCGGCKWQHLDYEKQLEFKQKQVIDAFERIAKVPVVKYLPIIGGEKKFYYRNKLEFTFTDHKWLIEFNPSDEEINKQNLAGLGFHLPGMFDKILDVEKCFLQEEPSNKIRLAVKQFAIENGYTFHNARSREGLLRNLIIRNSSDGQVMVIVVFNTNDESSIHALLSFIRDQFAEVTSLMYVINEKPNDSIADLNVVLFSGKDHLLEKMAPPTSDKPELMFKVGPKSFYQTNVLQARKLYLTAFEFAGFDGDELVYDFYSGTGTIALFVAPYVKKVVGVEYVEEAVADANKNASLNGIENTSFVAGDMAKLFDDSFIGEHGKPDVVITDPPRAGMHGKVIDRLLELGPQKIVYVSCNPATQARDIGLLSEKYKVEKVQPVDMFPQTHHVENVALLSMKTII